MTNNLRIRRQQINDAKRFFEILSSPDFVYFPVNIHNVEEEKQYLRLNRQKRVDNVEHQFSILLDDKVVGAVGVKIDQHRPYIGEVGYFIDREYWGKGLAGKAVEQVESLCFSKLELIRLELIILKKNTQSIRVAEKCGYRKEGIQRGKVLQDSDYKDAYLFSKIRSSELPS